MMHHPHVHMIVPGGGLSPDGERWIAAKPNFFLPVLVLSKLFRRLLLERLVAAHRAGKLTFFGAHALATPCPCCGGRMIIIETFEAGCQPQHRPTTSSAVIGIDTS
jgi:hypothetical protein